MTLNIAIDILLMTALLLANIPFILSNRLFIFLSVESKSIWLTIGEWFFYYLLLGGLSYLLELKTLGTTHSQEWEFYVTTLFMFMIFAFPGFIYRYNLAEFLYKRSQQK